MIDIGMYLFYIGMYLFYIGMYLFFQSLSDEDFFTLGDNPTLTEDDPFHCEHISLATNANCIYI